MSSDDLAPRCDYYTYAFLREDRTPYYVGKGCGNRAWTGNGRAVPHPGDPSRILILKKGLTEEQAFRHEIYVIAVLGRKNLETGILRNLTNGGEGQSGWVPSKEWRRKTSEAKRGKKLGPHSKEHRRKISASNRGKNLSEEHRRKISVTKTGKRLGEEHRRSMSEAVRGDKNPNFGKKHTEEVRRRMAKARTGKCRGDSNPRAKSFVFTSPTGERFVVTGGFDAFCREHRISRTTMCRALCRNCSPPPLNCWLVCYADADVY